MVRRCTRLSSNPRVVRIAAAVQPKPITSEKTALPLKPIFAKAPSVSAARRDRKPLSSNRMRKRNSIRICGRNPSTAPSPDSSPSASRLRKTGEAMRRAYPPKTSAKSDSTPDFIKSPGPRGANVSQNAAASIQRKSGTAKNPFSNSDSAR